MAMFEGLLGAACDGVLLELPRLYLVHGVDDDVFRHMASFATLADLLQPCRICALGFDAESDKCASLPELAALYNRRIQDDIEAAPLNAGGNDEGATGIERVVLIGYGFGAMVVHRMALQFQEAGREVALVLLDSEVTWPLAESIDRLGGYPWQGGEIEAALLMCRALGAADVARREVAALLDRGEGLPDGDAVEELVMRVFWELAGTVGMTQAYFLRCLVHNAYVLQRMRSLADKVREPPGPFAGDSLLLVSTDSPEFSGVRAANAKFCSMLEVVQVPGTHYSMLQRDEAGIPTALPQAISEFLLTGGHFGPAAQQAVRAAVEGEAEGREEPARLARPGYLEIVD